MAKQTTNLVSVDSLYFENNVREDACLQLPKMIDSIKRNGYKVHYPLVVSKKTDSFLVLCGNRRGLALVFLRDNDPEAYRLAVPLGKVPAVIHEGLTEEEEVVLRIDHSKDEDREPLDQWSEFQAIRQLVMVGRDSQEQIAVQLGIFHTKGKNIGKPNRSIIQPRANLARLPLFVQNEVKRLCYFPEQTKIRWSDIHALYTAYNSELVAFPDGDGPALTAAFAAVMNREVKAKSGNDAFSLTPKDARDKVAQSQSSLVKSLLLAFTGQGDKKWSVIDGKIALAEQCQTDVAILREHLGGTYDEVLTEAKDALADMAVS